MDSVTALSASGCNGHPFFLMMRKFGLIDSPLALILVNVTFTIPLPS